MTLRLRSLTAWSMAWPRRWLTVLCFNFSGSRLFLTTLRGALPLRKPLMMVSSAMCSRVWASSAATSLARARTSTKAVLFSDLSSFISMVRELYHPGDVKYGGASRGGEMVDALALGASGATHGGSSPLPGTSYWSSVKNWLIPAAQEPSEGGV